MSSRTEFICNTMMRLGKNGQAEMLSGALSGFVSGRLGSPTLFNLIDLPLDRGNTHRATDTWFDIRISNESPCLYQKPHSPFSETLLELSLLSVAGLNPLVVDLAAFFKLVRAIP